MDQTSDDSPQAAQHPFNQSSADFVLRTADLVDFRVHSQILGQSSPFFASMFALPQPPSTTPSQGDAGDTVPGTTPPVVPVSEDSTTLDLLLRLVYPVSKPRAQMKDPQAMVPVLLAATKYDMTLPVDIISDQLAGIVAKSPLQVWATACRTGLEDVARLAAEALKATWTDSDAHALSFMDELGDMVGISAGNYYRLKQFLSANQTPAGDGTFALLNPAPTPCVPSSWPWKSHSRSLDPLTLEPLYTDLPPTDMACRPSSRGGPATPFKGHQIILSNHSPVLKARLAELRAAASSVSVGTPDPNSVDPRSSAAPESGSSATPDLGSSAAQFPPSVTGVVLDFDEGPEVISVLLKACYDAETSLPVDLPRLAALLVASQKYKMAFIAPRIRAAWDTAATLGHRCPGANGHRPLAAYFVALAHGLTDRAQEAAKNALTLELKGAYVPFMEDAPALAYHRLLVFYDSHCAVVRERLGAAIASIPETIYDNTERRNVSTDLITDPLKAIAVTGRNGHRGLGELTKSLGDDVSRGLKKNKSKQPELVVWKLVRKTLRCIISTPDEIDTALKEVRRPDHIRRHFTHAFVQRPAGEDQPRLRVAVIPTWLMVAN